jgi:serine/threonine protein kinase
MNNNNIINQMQTNSNINMNISQNLKTNNNQNQPILNNIKNRLLILSPTVSEGIERESNKDDFEALEDKALGKGGFGHVWKVRHKLSGKIYAIKVINKDYIRKENMVDQINREIEIMYRTDHPHIIKLYNHYEDEDNFYLIMHCAGKGQLYSQLKRLKRLDERTVAQYMREVISAVKYLHSLKPPIIHRDIKPENVLLDSDGRAKLADFGWSNFNEENKKRETYCGTPEYLAPEMVTKAGHNEAIDTWSLGVLMFELLAGRPPFVYKGDPTALYADIKGLKIKWTDDFPILAKNLISKILKLKPTERPSLDDILEHPWFKETPLLRPLLQVENYNPEVKLRSHLLNYSQDDEEKIQNKIKLVLNKKRDSIKSDNVGNNININNNVSENLKGNNLNGNLNNGSSNLSTTLSSNVNGSN